MTKATSKRVRSAQCACRDHRSWKGNPLRASNAGSLHPLHPGGSTRSFALWEPALLRLPPDDVTMAMYWG